MSTVRVSRTLVLTLPLLALACDKAEHKPEAVAAKKSAAAAASAEGKYDARRTKDDDARPKPSPTPARGADEKPAPPKPPQKKTRRSATQVPPPENLAAAPGDATKSANGVSCTVLTAGEGELVKLNDSVKMHYTGWSMDGTTVETSEGRKSPRTVRVNRTPIPGWADALQMMKPGEKRRCWIPQEQGFVGRANAPEGPLVYDIEVVEVMRAPVTPPDVAAPPADASKTESGLAYKVLSKGKGDKPDEWDEVTVHYSGWTTDGKMFDSSATRGKPATFPLGKVIPGWTEGLQLMTKGEKARLWIPEELAYQGRPGKPAGMLVFDVELVEIIDKPEPPPPPPVPEDVAAPPADAKSTASGLKYKVLQKGKGKDKPTADNVVKVHYSGWTTDGKMFDSSVVRGQEAEFPLGRVIAGWTEGLQLMTVGEKTRFWIPEDLAYKGRPGKPAGMLVFEVELIEIK